MQESTTKALNKALIGLEGVIALLRKDTEEALKTVDPIEIVKHFDALRQSAERIKTGRAALDELVDNLSTVQIPVLFTNRSLKTINIEGVGRATVSYRWSCSMIDKPKGMSWLEENGAGSLIQQTVNASSLAAFAKEKMLEDKELPPSLFKTSTNPYTSITKA